MGTMNQKIAMRYYDLYFYVYLPRMVHVWQVV